MTKICFFTLRLAALLCVLGCASSTFAHSGHVNWGPWDFDWEVKDSSGLAIRNVKYQNEELIYKASMPVIRVKYDRDGDNDGCGPYADQISWGSLVDISFCGGARVCQQTYSSGGREWLELGILAEIGEYRIYQVYYLSTDGWINAALWSKGLQCEINHTHHPYWRMDFDVAGAANDQVFVYADNRGNEGWGPGWHKYTQEQQDIKNPPVHQVWFQRDNSTGHGVWIVPGANDGTFDAFAAIDIATRRYHSNEDEPWRFGAWGDVGYNDGEDIQEKDDIFWYISHLHHMAADGPGVWHHAGPWLHVSR
jgi:hypothetical protein